MTTNNIPMDNDKLISFVDALAQEIRRVDGNHSLGAAALAEALMPFLSKESAIEQDRQSRGEPVAYRYMERDAVRYVSHPKYMSVSAIDAGIVPEPLFAAPQPAEPVKVPSDVAQRIWAALCSMLDQPSVSEGMKDDIREWMSEGCPAAQPAASAESAGKGMTADRATYFLRRFKHDEKMLGPNEQAALDYAITALSAPVAAQPSVPDVDVIEWLETEVSATSCRYHGDPSYDHDAYWMRDRVLSLLEQARKAFAPTPPADKQPQQEKEA